MTADKRSKAKKSYDFSKKNKVSVWVSQHPYAEIPDEYFDETFISKTRAKNRWSDNFRLQFFCPENMETNGSHDGLVSIERSAGECSFSSSFIEVLMSKSRKKKLAEISWIVLLFEHEYSVKLTGIDQDDYLTFLGAFDYDDSTESLSEPAEQT